MQRRNMLKATVSMGKSNEDSFFFVPGANGKFAIVSDDENVEPRYVERANLLSVIATENTVHNRLLHGFITNYRDFRSAEKCVELRSFPALVKHYSFKKRMPRCDGALLMSGASALRVRTKLFKDMGDKKAQRLLQDESEKARHRSNQKLPFVSTDDFSKDSGPPFVIECRNFYNYYHFTTESMIYLQMYRDYALSGDIHFLTGGTSEVQPYLLRAVEDFYPDLFDKVCFLTGGTRYKKAIIPFNTNHLYHCSDRTVMKDIEEGAGFSNNLKDGDLRPETTENYRWIFRNSRDEYIQRHRDEVLKRTYVHEGSRYVYVSRKQGASRQRSVVGEDALIEMLSRYGFDVVQFENMTPLQQASLCHSVDILVSAHGAGFTNMLYGKPGSYFIELSHLQTARHRFGDFNMHASASGVNYTHFFADHDVGESDEVPNLHHEGHAGISISECVLQKLELFIASLVQKDEQKQFFSRIEGLRRKEDHATLISVINLDTLRSAVCPRTVGFLTEAYEKTEMTQEALKAYSTLVSLVPYRADLWAKVLELAEALADEQTVSWALEMSEPYRRARWSRWCRTEHGAIAIQG